MQRFKERLTARRNALSLSQAQLAHNSKVSERSIAGYETKDKPPNFRIVEKLAAALNVSPTWLLGGEESQFLSDRPPPPDPVVVADLLTAIERLQEELYTVRRHAERLKHPPNSEPPSDAEVLAHAISPEKARRG